MKSNLLSILFLFMLSWSAAAQTFEYRAAVDQPDSAGYHQIVLPPEVTCHLSPSRYGAREEAGGFADIRLFQSDERNVPFLQTREKRVVRYRNFKTYEIYNRDYSSGWHYESRVYVKNTDGAAINHLVLKIRNFDDQRHLRLSGSDDGNRWFIIKDGFTFYGAWSDTATSSYNIIRFPLSDYKYFKIEVDESWRGHSHDDHIQIQDVGYFVSAYDEGQYLNLPAPKIQQVDTVATKQTTVHFDFGNAHYFDRLQLTVATEGPFHRKADLYRRTQVNDSTYRFDYVQSMWVSSTHLNDIDFNNWRMQAGKIVIHNKDDYPLEIESLQGLQLKRYLTAPLDPAVSYHVKFGNDTLAAPEYDLEYFRNQIPDRIPSVRVRGVESIDTPVVITPEKEPSFFETKSFLWSVIGAVLLLFGFMTVRMLGDMKKERSDDKPAT